MKKFNIFPYLFVFLATFVVLQLFNKSPDPVLSSGDVGLKTVENEYAIGKDIRVDVQNNQAGAIEVLSECNEMDGRKLLLPPFTVLKYENEGFTEVSNTANLPECTDSVVTTIQPGQKETFSLLNYSYSDFGEIGRYKLQLNLAEVAYSTPEFEIHEPGVFTKLWRGIIYQPILNVLIGILVYMPGHKLGLSVILLTIIIRTILLVPSQKAMKAQLRMQEMQPKIEELKQKYKDDQARLAQETMLLWKTSKVNPLSSCLPILLQLPILIALYSVVNGGLSPDRSALIYDFMPAFSLHEIDPIFLGFDLLTRSMIVLPLIVGGLQFIQMQLMMTKQKKKKAAQKEGSAPKPMQNEMEMANKMMKYIMPVMIAVFTAQLPAAVGLYWGTSTFYGILQQLVVNKEGSKSKSPEDDVQIRVINKKH
ncbi:MAG: YidC/Oxa1 family membrane protein insertase [Patescibacteria group bacterium]